MKKIRYIHAVHVGVFVLGLLCGNVHTNAGHANAAQNGDARLTQLPQILRNNEAVVPPLKVPQSMYLQMHPQVRKALSGKMVIAPNMPLKKDGTPIMRLPAVPFTLIWDKIESAVARDDWQEIAFIRKYFQAQPMPYAAVYSFLLRPLYNADTAQKLSKALNFPLYSTSRGGKVFFMADVFAAFGGKAQEKVRIGLCRSMRELHNMQSTAKSRQQSDAIFLLYGGDFIEQALNSLRSCGIDAVLARNYF